MADERTPILVISGPSGVGKSTVSRLVAAAIDPSVHLRIDDFWPFFVNGLVEPSLPDAAHQNEVLGAAVAAAAIQFASGGYTVVLDGHLFPEGIEGLAVMCAARDVPLHYAVLRADLDTCIARAAARNVGTGRFASDTESFAQLHARFEDLGPYEANVINAGSDPDDVAANVLAALQDGRQIRIKPGPSATTRAR